MSKDRLNNAEVQERVDKCYELRNGDRKMKHVEWTKYCHENYGDKSEMQYTQYWSKSGERYQENWKEKLGKAIDPAVNELYILLSSEDEKIRQRAIDQIFKYTGNDIIKQEIEHKGEITINWGDE